MLIHYDGHDYEFDFDEIDLTQASVMKRKYGLTMLALEKGLGELDPDALRVIYWLMLSQSGQHANPDTVQFKPVKFAKALNDAAAKEAEERPDGEAPKEA